MAIPGVGGTDDSKKSIIPKVIGSKANQTSIDFQSFLKIMAAQMQNQGLSSDSGSGTDNSQYITEMAIFTAVQAMNTQTAESNKQYAASLVGSDVNVTIFDQASNQTKNINGTVTRALFDPSSGDAGVQIGDQVYNVASVMDIYGYHSTQSTADRQYAASLVGKDVVVQVTDSKTNATSQVSGKVQKVTFDPSTGAASLIINDKPYDMSSIISVSD